MAVSETTHDVSIRIFFAYCDICSTSLKSDRTSGVLTIKPSVIDASETASFRHRSGFLYELLPILTQEVFETEISAKGWTKVEFHGKAMLICPSCSAK